MANKKVWAVLHWDTSDKVRGDVSVHLGDDGKTMFKSHKEALDSYLKSFAKCRETPPDDEHYMVMGPIDLQSAETLSFNPTPDSKCGRCVRGEDAHCKWFYCSRHPYPYDGETFKNTQYRRKEKV